MQRQIQLITTIFLCVGCFLAQAQVTIQPDGISNGNASEPNSNEIEFEENGFLAEIDLDNNGVLGLGTGSTADDLFISTNGNIGVDVDDPESKLHILNGDDVSLSDHGYLLLGALSERNIAFDNNEIQSRNNGGAASLLFNVEGGNVGIGTTAPGDLLHINGGDFRIQDATPTISLKDNNGDDLGLFNSLLNTINIQNQTTGISADIALVTEDGELVLHEDGDVGISAGNPSAKLDIHHDASLSKPHLELREPNDIDFSRIKFSNTSSRYWAIQSAPTNSLPRHQLTYNDGTDQFDMITARADNLSVGIRTDLPSFTLSVAGSAGKFGGGMWSTFSDARLKKNVEDFTDGLEVIKQIRPVWYEFNGKADMATDERYVGVIAQEIQKVAPYTIQPLKKTSKDGSTQEYLSYDGTALTYMLVNAVQEQQSQLEEKDRQINNLQQQLTGLHNRLDQLEALITGQNEEHTIDLNGVDTPQLYQNTPNPFNGKTQIGYYLPEGTQQAQLRITASTGQILKTIALQGAGEGQVKVNINGLASGTYQYSLLVDGRLVKTKQMMVIK